MKISSTSIAIVNGECQRMGAISMAEDELDATNRDPTPDQVLGDSWFSSVDLVENMSKQCVEDQPQPLAQTIFSKQHARNLASGFSPLTLNCF